MPKYSYEIKGHEKENISYKKFFEAFGHQGALLSLELFEKLSEEQKLSLCTVYFMAGKDKTVQILCPIISQEAVESSSNRRASAVIAMNKVMKHCKSKEFEPTSYISTTERSDLASLFGFNGEPTSANIGNTKFYQTERVQNQNVHAIDDGGKSLI